MTTPPPGPGTVTGTVSASPTGSTSSPALRPSATFAATDRPEFLLTGPDCDELAGWYAQYPADPDLDLLAACVRACDRLPAPTRSNERLIVALVKNQVGRPVVAAALSGGAAPELRRALTSALAQTICERLDSGAGSLWQFQHDLVHTYGLDVHTANGLMAAAARACPEHGRLLGLFDQIDVSRAVSALRDHIDQDYPRGPGGGGPGRRRARRACPNHLQPAGGRRRAGRRRHVVRLLRRRR